MDIDRILSLLKKNLEFFGTDHTVSKIELYRKYQKYLKIWKLDNFETIDEKLNASKNIEKAHKAYDFIKANWNYILFLKKKEESYDRYIIIIVFVFLFVSMMTYMHKRANNRVREAKIQAVEVHESNWAWTHGVSDTLIKMSKMNALDDFWGKVIKDSVEIADHLISDCFIMDPIKTAEILSSTDDFYYSPYTYGFSNYSRENFRENILTYGNVMDLSNKGPNGTHLGGTGIAISNKSHHKDLALEYSYWIAGADCQKSIFYKSGGQPGNSIAWENQQINDECNGFFANTRLTLNQAWIRPRHNGYMKFQDESGEIINEYLQSNTNENIIIDKLKIMYAESFE